MSYVAGFPWTSLGVINSVSSVGAAAAKPRMDLVVRNAIQAGDIPGPRYLANGQEACVQFYLRGDSPLNPLDGTTRWCSL